MNNEPAGSGSALLKPAEAGVELRLSKATIYRLIASGDLKAVQVGARKATRIPRTEINAYITRSGRKSSAA